RSLRRRPVTSKILQLGDRPGDSLVIYPHDPAYLFSRLGQERIALELLDFGERAPFIGRQHEAAAARIEIVEVLFAIDLAQGLHPVTLPDLLERRVVGVADLVRAVPVRAARKHL